MYLIEIFVFLVTVLVAVYLFIELVLPIAIGKRFFWLTRIIFNKSPEAELFEKRVELSELSVKKETEDLQKKINEIKKEENKNC